MKVLFLRSNEKENPGKNKDKIETRFAERK